MTAIFEAFTVLILTSMLLQSVDMHLRTEGQALWVSGAWSGCEPAKQLIINGSLMEAAIGIQWRNVTCTSATGVALHPSSCLHVPTVQRGCIVKQRCQVSIWSSWEILQEGCIADDEQVLPVVRRRRRRVVAAPVGGEKCPELQEKEIITDGKNLSLCSQRYKWLPSPWSRCQAISDSGEENFLCGGGVQFRSQSCVRANDSRPVDDFLCRGVAKLPAVQQCEIPCDGDCQVSDWSSWSACHPAQCFDDDPAGSGSITRPLEAFNRFIQSDNALAGFGYRVRQRRVLANASSRGVECPPLNEMQMCRSPFSSCYAWKPRPLESCLLHANQSKCGLGSRDFIYRCLHYTSKVVDDSYCSGLPFPSVANQSSCHVTCPEECALSDWSEWGSCVGGRRHRSRILIGLPENPKSCTETSRLHQVENCSSPVEQNSKYHWLTLPWSECILDQDKSCGTGYQMRDVQCFRDDTQHVLDEWCSLLERPIEHRFCHVQCPQHCVVSQWSEWSPCGAQREQSRYRLLLTPPAYDGDSCPPLIEKRVCNDENVPFRFVLHPWSKCEPSSSTGCGSGYRTRVLECLDASNGSADMSQCLAFRYEEISRVSLVEECTVQCDQMKCEFSSWSTWSPCGRNCGGVRNKKRAVIGPPGKIEQCQKQHVTQVAEECPCISVAQQEDEDWTPCYAIDSLCGQGKQYRRKRCHQIVDGSPLPIQWCAGEDYDEKECHIPCPVDCQLSAWSAWSPCNSTCGPGIQKRTRKIETSPAFRGRPCGSLEEIQPCNTHPCHWYQWHASPWSPCLMTGECGNSIQHRKVQCINEFENAIVSDALCDPELKPSTFRHCHVSCPGECVVSEWTQWTPCITCTGTRKRTRWIIRQPIGNQSCPILEDVEPCSSDLKNCWTYQWKTTVWSSCLPLGGSVCGEGIRTRIAYCARSDGRMVDEMNCDVRSKPSVSEKWCNIECPIDCRLSDWSKWNETECMINYTTGNKTRSREIEVAGNAYGRECPESLKQSVPCPANPPYHWRHSKWTSCNMQGSDCGEGVKRRKLECSSNDIEHNQQDNIDLCSAIPKPYILEDEEEEPCRVLCPYEKQIKVSVDDSLLGDAASQEHVDHDEVRILYYPNDDEFSIWMVAMIVIGSLFLIFVGVTIILICTSRTEPSSDVKRYASDAVVKAKRVHSGHSS